MVTLNIYGAEVRIAKENQANSMAALKDLDMQWFWL